jgi:hypothetical protein
MGSCQRVVPVILLVCLLCSGCANDSRADDPSAPETQETERDRPAADPPIPAPPSPDEGSDLAGTQPFVASDVVIVIDSSTLSAVASGIDVDENGIVGRNRSAVTEFDPLAPPAQFWTTDPGDTLHALQIRVVQALVPRLAARQNHVGLASFNVRSTRYGPSATRLVTGPEILVPVGPPGAVLAALAEFPPAQERRRTDLARLFDRAAQLLDVAPANADGKRSRVILLLFLGEPSAPDGIGWSSREALARADEYGERGISVWVIPFLPGKDRFLNELTRRSGGRVIPLDQLDTQFGALSR